MGNFIKRRKQSRFSIVNKLAQEREKLGLTQGELDRKIYGDGKGVGKYESDYRSPTLPKLIEWAEALGCEVTIVRKEQNYGNATVGLLAQNRRAD